jgi:decaprenyl-phosphate phosphoribosyltransferase
MRGTYLQNPMPTPPRRSTLPWPAREAPLVAGGSSDGAAAPFDAAGVRGRGWSHAAVVTARPKQWLKNLLVIAAAGAAGALGHDDVPLRVGLACLAFCLISAGIYALNDVRDADEDRRHPRKRFRPVAAGELEPLDAVLLGAGGLIAGVLLCFAIAPLLGAVGLGYIALTLSYTWIWRRIVVLDIFAIAAGFVLRALAGGVAAPVTLSRWFVAVVTCAAVFVAAGKRHAEMIRTTRTLDADDGQPAGRRVLRHYTPGGLRLLLYGSGAGALFAYCVWAFELSDVDGVPWRLLTVVPFAVCLVRYGELVRAGAGEAPEEMLLADRRLAIGGVAWLLLFALSVHAAV